MYERGLKIRNNFFSLRTCVCLYVCDSQIIEWQPSLQFTHAVNTVGIMYTNSNFMKLSKILCILCKSYVWIASWNLYSHFYNNNLRFFVLQANYIYFFSLFSSKQLHLSIELNYYILKTKKI